jgi:hypothetical protein
VSLESISLNNISRVEVISTPTPESPGAALAGSVNFVPRTAFERSKPQLTFSTYVQMRDDQRDFHKSVGGREQRTRKVLPGVEFNYVVPVNKNFGFAVSGTAFKAWSHRDSMVNTWRGANAVTDGNAFPDTTPDRPYLSNYVVRDGWLLRKRSSLSLTVDYRLSPERSAFADGDAHKLQHQLRNARHHVCDHAGRQFRRRLHPWGSRGGHADCRRPRRHARSQHHELHADAGVQARRTDLEGGDGRRLLALEGSYLERRSRLVRADNDDAPERHDQFRRRRHAAAREDLGVRRPDGPRESISTTSTTIRSPPPISPNRRAPT